MEMRMRTRVSGLALLAAMFAATPSKACMTDAEIVLDDVKYADTVIVGRVSNYKVVTPKGEKPGLIWDYARFDVRVDEVLKGNAGQSLTVTWDNSTFGEPDSMTPGQYLIALREPESSILPPLRGPSATIMPRPEPKLPTLLQAPCSSPFMFNSDSDEAAAVRKILKQQQQ